MLLCVYTMCVHMCIYIYIYIYIFIYLFIHLDVKIITDIHTYIWGQELLHEIRAACRCPVRSREASQNPKNKTNTPKVIPLPPLPASAAARGYEVQSLNQCEKTFFASVAAKYDYKQKNEPAAA